MRNTPLVIYSLFREKIEIYIQSTSPAFTVVRRLVDAVLSDLPGVLIQTAKLYKATWKELFDSSLQQHAIQEHKSAQLFDWILITVGTLTVSHAAKGQKFLESHRIELPYKRFAPPRARYRIGQSLGIRAHQSQKERIVWPSIFVTS